MGKIISMCENIMKSRKFVKSISIANSGSNNAISNDNNEINVKSSNVTLSPQDYTTNNPSHLYKEVIFNASLLPTEISSFYPGDGAATVAHRGRSSGATYSFQFLSTVLSQRGPSASPHAEETKWLIRQHLLALVDAYPSSAPKRPPLRTTTAAPSTSSRLTAPSHRLRQRCIQHSREHLALERSLATIPSSPVKTLTLALPKTPSLPSTKRRIFLLLLLLFLLLSHMYSSLSPYTARPPAVRPTDDPAEVYRRNAINKILEAVHADIAALRKSREVEIEGLFATQAELRRRSKSHPWGSREMLEEKEGLEQQLQLVLMNTDVLEGWLRQNDGKWRREEGSIPSEMYLKNVRVLSREQFFQRALATKVGLYSCRFRLQAWQLECRIMHHRRMNQNSLQFLIFVLLCLVSMTKKLLKSFCSSKLKLQHLCLQFF
ncbi:hypothetical protein HPP92_022660 [Vanilla planifolia]|uniref:SB domain-containing protein n=1 Tax=Vanilla planifolia TaxID=51239 RepID=A0A835PUI5_VANPL|nr:hypothetical protein HPP92_022660 [Vanilla planifolia]